MKNRRKTFSRFWNRKNRKATKCRRRPTTKSFHFKSSNRKTTLWRTSKVDRNRRRKRKEKRRSKWNVPPETFSNWLLKKTKKSCREWKSVTTARMLTWKSSESIKRRKRMKRRWTRRRRTPPTIGSVKSRPKFGQRRCRLFRRSKQNEIVRSIFGLSLGKSIVSYSSLI